MGAPITGTIALGSLAGCASVSGDREHGSYPLDRTDPRVRAARAAEKAAYDYYELEFDEHFIDVDALDLQIRVVEVGSGPPLVMIPGGIGHGVKWLPLLPEFPDYTVYVMDRPGGGLSDGIDHRSWSLATIAARTTETLFDHFELSSAPVIGNSMGGLWTLRFALAHRERAAELSLIGCPALYPGTSAPFPRRVTSVPYLGGLIFENVVRPEDANGVREGFEQNGHPTMTASNLPIEYLEALYRMDQLPYFTLSWVSIAQSALRLRGAVPEAALTPEDLRNVRTPVMIAWGQNDPFGTVDQGRAGVQYFRDAEFNAVGVGHFPWLDVPDTCGELVRALLTRSR